MVERLRSKGVTEDSVLKQVLELLATPEVEAERARVLGKFYAPYLDHITTSSQAVMENALDELAGAAMVAVVADDPNRPALTWFESPPHEERGIQVPGTRHGFDGADRVYRHAFVDPRNRYEIRGKRPKDTASFYFWLEACPSAAPGWGAATRYLDTDSLVIDADGSFVVTIDNSPADGRANHLQLTENVNHISARDTLVDWGREMPTALSILAVTSAVPPPLRSKAALAERGVAELARHAKTVMAYHRNVVRSLAPNTLGNPFNRMLQGRDVPWGVVCNGRYALGSDEALVITVDAASARYFGLQIADIWMVSIDYGHLIASLNNSQVFRNTDCSITWVIAQQDPGLWNWIETGPFLEGTLLVRWELLRFDPDLESLIRSAVKVKLGDLNDHLPTPQPRVTPDQRKVQRKSREDSIARRFTFLVELTVAQP